MHCHLLHATMEMEVLILKVLVLISPALHALDRIQHIALMSIIDFFYTARHLVTQA